VRCQQLLHLRIGQWTAHLIACDLVGRGDEAVSRKGNTMARTTSFPVLRLRPYMVNGARDRADRSLLVESLLIDTDGPIAASWSSRWRGS